MWCSVSLLTDFAIVSSRAMTTNANDQWEMKTTGPKAFERSYTLEGSSGEHRPEVIRVIVRKMVSANL
jgi:hypothetical protein